MQKLDTETLSVKPCGMFKSRREAERLLSRQPTGQPGEFTAEQCAFYISAIASALEYRVKWAVLYTELYTDGVSVVAIYRNGKFRYVREVASLGSLRTFQFLPTVYETRSAHRLTRDGPEYIERSISQDGFTRRELVLA